MIPFMRAWILKVLKWTPNAFMGLCLWAAGPTIGISLLALLPGAQIHVLAFCAACFTVFPVLFGVIFLLCMAGLAVHVIDDQKVAAIRAKLGTEALMLSPEEVGGHSHIWRDHHD